MPVVMAGLLLALDAVLKLRIVWGLVGLAKSLKELRAKSAASFRAQRCRALYSNDDPAGRRSRPDRIVFVWSVRESE